MEILVAAISLIFHAFDWPRTAGLKRIYIGGSLRLWYRKNVFTLPGIL